MGSPLLATLLQGPVYSKVCTSRRYPTAHIMTPTTSDSHGLHAHRRTHHWISAGEVFLAAGLYSLTPLTIHYTATEANPLIFNSVSRGVQALVLLMYLQATRSRYFGNQPTIRSVVGTALAGAHPHKSDWTEHSSLRLFFGLIAVNGRQQSKNAGSSSRRPILYVLASCATLPMVWTILSRSDYALYAWSTRYVEVAVSAAIFELWPLMMVIFVSLFSMHAKEQIHHKSMSRQHVFLMCAAFVGLALLVLGQSGVTLNAIQIFASHGLIGILLAILAAAIAGSAPASAIFLGHVLQRGYSRSSAEGTESHTTGDRAESLHSDTRDDPLPEQQRLWFALMVSAIAYAITAPANLLISLTGLVGAVEISARSILGSLLLGGVILAAGGLLLHRANARPQQLGINAIFYMTPIFSIFLLAIFPGISLPRPDLFWMGAGLVLALNIIMQSSPDEEPDYGEYGTEAPPGTRLGFTSLILALWASGTIVYLRDEMLPSSWLSWNGGEFWTLLSLSATVFALIFGFRMARLSGRLTSEDNMMLDLFRKCEYFVNMKVLHPSVLDNLRQFDVARPAILPERYETIVGQFYDGERVIQKRRAWYRAHMDRFGDVPRLDVDIEDMVSARRNVDQLAHSKQQGKDISELISICIFAAITISLGLMARPLPLESIDGGWTGFLSELFVSLFVSIVAFLAFNLFDVRRDRLIPLIAKEPDNPSRFGLFFRHRRDPVLPQRMSVVITILMVAMFGILLYNKWF